MMKGILEIKCPIKCCCQVFTSPISLPNQAIGVLKKKKNPNCSNLSLHLNQKKLAK